VKIFARRTRPCRANFRSRINPWHLARAARTLAAGGIVAHATEGVWGLACDPFDELAVKRLLRLKQRSPSHGLILIGAGCEDFRAELAMLDAADREEVVESWPGAVTYLLPNVQFPEWITGGRDRVAVRVPGHEQARALAARFGGPVVSTSLNVSGRPAARDYLQALNRFPRALFPTSSDYVLPGVVAGRSGPSEIRLPGGTTLRGAG